MANLGAIATGTLDDSAWSLTAYAAAASRDTRRAGQINATGKIAGTVTVSSTGLPAPGSHVLFYDNDSYQNIGFRRADAAGAFVFGPLGVGAAFFYAVALPPSNDPVSRNGEIFTKLTAVS